LTPFIKPQGNEPKINEILFGNMPQEKIEIKDKENIGGSKETAELLNEYRDRMQKVKEKLEIGSNTPKENLESDKGIEENLVKKRLSLDPIKVGYLSSRNISGRLGHEYRTLAANKKSIFK